MILVVDNYDSFTFNLVHYVMELGAEVHVVRNDADFGRGLHGQRRHAASSSRPDPARRTRPGSASIWSPPAPRQSCRCSGVCLGHQAIGQHFGGKVVRGGLMHGKTSPVDHDGTRRVRAACPRPSSPRAITRSIVEDIPECLVVNATSETPGLDGTAVMGFRHAELPIHGVQFHPESIATEHGHALLANFLEICGLPVKVPA